MGKLNKYAGESGLMRIKISYGDEDFSFNLFKELVVDENTINKQIKEQPSSYAFLTMLHKKLIRVMKDKENEMIKIFKVLFIKYKKDTDEGTGRVYSNDMAEALAYRHATHQAAIRLYHQAQENANILYACVSSFEQRANLIQTISANLRRET